MAWLHSAPKLHEKDANPKSRVNTLPDDSHSRRLPEANSYLTLCFELSGFCLSGSMSAVPLTWCEIDAFVRRSGYHLNGWESEQIIKMSNSYCNMLSKAKSIDCPAPYIEGYDSDEAIEQMRKRVNEQWNDFK